MLDRYTHAGAQYLLRPGARVLCRWHIHADAVTCISLISGLLSLPALYLHYYYVALAFIALNRVLDGLDGALARATHCTMRGGFLDICADFIFYPAVVLGFALADPDANARAAAFLLFAFACNSSCFLACAVIAAKKDRAESPGGKMLHYTGGLTEGTETIVFFILFCLLPHAFAPLAVFFAWLCLLTAGWRLLAGYRMAGN